MYFSDIDLLIKQILPPNWRFVKVNNGAGFSFVASAKQLFLKSISKPFKLILNDFENYRTSSYEKVNLNGQSMVIEHHVRRITGVSYGVFVSDVSPNVFSVNIPAGNESSENEIKKFLTQVVPIGFNFQIIYY